MANLIIDIETRGLSGDPGFAVAEVLPHEYDLCWLDPAYQGQGPVAEFERVRRFKHLGGAIAWARRKLYHGEALGESIELRTIIRSRRSNGMITEAQGDVSDITLAGFCQWKAGLGYRGANYLILTRPERKCRAARL